MSQTETEPRGEAPPSEKPSASARVMDLNLTIHERMVNILAELPAIGKNQRNEQQRFMYRGYDDVLNALNPLLGKHGVFIVPNVIERLTGERQTKSGSTMYEVNLHVEFTFYGRAGDSVVASGWGEGTDSGDKATNKAMTMALKYVLFQTFAISSAETTDADAASAEETTRGRQGNGARQRTRGELPKSWEEMRTIIAVRLGDGVAADFSMFARQLAAQLYEGADVGDVFGKLDPAALTTQQWQDFGSKVARAVVALVEATDGQAPPSEADLRAAFATVSSTVLDGPGAGGASGA